MENCRHLWQLELKSLQWAAEAILAKSNVICSQSPVTLASLWSHLSQVRRLNVYLFLIKESQRSGILGNIVLGYQMNQVFWWQNKNTKSYRCILLSFRVRAGFALLPPPSVVSVCVWVGGGVFGFQFGPELPMLNKHSRHYQMYILTYIWIPCQILTSPDSV